MEAGAVSHHADLAALTDHVAARFAHHYGRAPSVIAAAPGRVNLIGEHTDYNAGFVLPMAIERWTVVAGGRAPRKHNVQLFSATLNQTAEFSLETALADSAFAWASYVRGVLSLYKDLGHDVGAVDLLIDSTVPLGGGLSSSASLEVATATFVEGLTGGQLAPADKALLCQKAEHQFAGVPCGIMDQFASVMAQADHLMLLDCRSQEVEMVPLADADVSVLIINCNVKHALSGGEYAERRSQCESAARTLGVDTLREITLPQLEALESRLDPVVYRRARHVIGEIERTVKAAKAIRAGRWRGAGELMYASHNSLRDDFEVSCRELDVLVELAQGIGEAGGMIGSRMTGGGFGGCTVSLVHSDRVEEISAAIRDGYRQQTRIEPDLFATRPAAGAMIIKQ
jgi:galactokinase